MTKLAESRQSLGPFIQLKFWKSDFYFLNGSKICMVATSVYISHKKETHTLRISNFVENYNKFIY